MKRETLIQRLHNLVAAAANPRTADEDIANTLARLSTEWSDSVAGKELDKTMNAILTEEVGA
jgi:hypothetical protein